MLPSNGRNVRNAPHKGVFFLTLPVFCGFPELGSGSVSKILPGRSWDAPVVLTMPV